MSKLTLIANIIAKPEQVEFIKAELIKLIAPTRAEQGCLGYDLHQDNDNPAHFLFFENWQSRELWQQHMNSPHLKEYLAVTEGKVASFTLNEMTHIG
ncbi:antibiotic biosynthesis monooxygenase [Neiella marina]|uniref:Antibiotic biosynthesis monooxygenase n=1 Tax=Neiella marina TaxID=508461 RepID=A0A8J2U4J0_9GAMM|nr:putative quinol monooxygenase [Neiella marina]GGA75576.1 antibiotic biosynthesis monooxygenase [Neiella marina]